jgi:hypothetical protein
MIISGLAGLGGVVGGGTVVVVIGTAVVVVGAIVVVAGDAVVLSGAAVVVAAGIVVVAGAALAQLTANDIIPTSRTRISKKLADFDFIVIFLLTKYYI